MTPESPTNLERALGELRGAAVPDDLCDEVMARVKRERRFLGLGAREWAVVGAAFGSFTLALQVMVSWASERLLTF